MCSPAHLISNISITILHACVKNFDENAFTDPMWTHWMFHLRFATHFGIALHRCDLGSSRAKLTDLRTRLGSHLPVQILYLICFSCFQMVRCSIGCVHKGVTCSRWGNMGILYLSYMQCLSYVPSIPYLSYLICVSYVLSSLSNFQVNPYNKLNLSNMTSNMSSIFVCITI